MSLHSTKVQALEHELAGVKEDRKRLEEGGSHSLTIIDEVRNWGGKEKWVRLICARRRCAPLVLRGAAFRGPAGTLRSLQNLFYRFVQGERGLRTRPPPGDYGTRVG